MSRYENSLYSYIEGRMMPHVRRGDAYLFRNNSFAGRITRYDGSQGFIKNNAKGTPDAVLLYKGRFIGLELKSETGRQSPGQKAVEALVNGAGGIYKVLRRPEDLEALLKELDAKRQ